jgi:hypothetical protein
MTSEAERIAKLKAEHEEKMREAERELQKLREAERKHKEAARAAQLAAKHATEAEKAARAEVTAQREAAREASEAERAAQDEARRLQEALDAVHSGQQAAASASAQLGEGEQGSTDSAILNVVQGMQVAFERTLREVVSQIRTPGGPAGVNREEKGLFLSAIKQKMRALNVKAADMTQELDSFFLPLDSYIKAAGTSLAPAAELEEARVSLLHNILGDAGRNAMKGTTEAQKATYALYKEAIRTRFLVECDPCHLTSLVRSAAMSASETTKEYVTRLWALVSRIPDLTLDLQQREILTSLRMGHSNLQIRNLLMEKQPKTVPEAERLCEEYEAREKMTPVSTKFASAMVAANPSVPVDNVQSGGYRGPKHKGRGGQGNKNHNQGNQSNRGGGTARNSGPPQCHRCQKHGHIAKYCLANAPAVLPPSHQQRSASGGQSGGNHRSQSRPILNVGATPMYSDYAATQEHQQQTAWPPHYLPQFDYSEAAASAAYEGGYSQDEVYATGDTVLSRLSQRVGLSYGYGSPQRQHVARTRPDPRRYDINEVSDDFSEWWVPVKFPQCDYLFKVDTGARVNVLSMADLSRLGYQIRDLTPSNLCLVGFNRVVVYPLGQLRVRICVNGVTFFTQFHVVERCNSPLLCLRDAARARLVNVASSYGPPAPVTEASTPGCYKHEIVSLQLTPDAKPKQFPPRKVPLALQAQARSQLDEMLRDGVIERVTEPSPWCHPMQIAHKPDGRLRICMDPRYLNQFLERAIFPFPSLEQVFSSVRNAKFFSKLDLTWGFWNLQLDEASSKLCTFCTPWGVFRYRRLPFGVSPAPEVFHRVLADVLRDIPGVIHYVDDVLIYGTTKAEHDQRLRTVLQRLRDAGFALSEAKCQYSQPSVVFLGHLISGTAIRPDPSKVAALQAMRPPTNISEHRGLMGFINFLAQYVPHFSAVTEPLRRLQSTKSHFRWTEDQQQAFDLLKKHFAEEPCLAPFDEYAPLSLATDASATGLGAVLLQHGRPVLYAARSLTDAETRYSTIEKELLAVVFALRKCHFYTYGRPVRILTDHRSLLGLVTTELDQMTPRLRRFVERLFPYSLTWEYIPGKENVIPDYLSRMAPVPPSPDEVAEALTFDAADTRFTKILLGGDIFYESLATASLDDPLFTLLRKELTHGWRRKPPVHVAGASQYWPLRFRLRVSGPFLLLDDDRVCVPPGLQQQALQLLHLGHPGVTGMQAKARQVMYWPGWTKDITNYVQGCVPCATVAAQPPRPPLFQEPPPEFPGDHVAADHFQFSTESYLVAIDTYSGFPFLHKCHTPTAASLLAAMQNIFLVTGLPRVFLSDGGSAFTSHAFQTFLEACHVRHRKSTPQYAQSNGAAERAVRTLKTLRAKCTTPFELFQAILELQNTPRAPGNVSPSEVFLGRAQRTWTRPGAKAVSVSWAARTQSLLAAQKNAQDRLHRAPGRPEVLFPGTRVLLRDYFGKNVTCTVCAFGDAPRAYLLRLPSGHVIQRNRSFLFPLPRQSQLPTAMSPPTRTMPKPSQPKLLPSLPPLGSGTTRTTRTTDNLRPRAGNTAAQPAVTVSTSPLTFVTPTGTPTSFVTPLTAASAPSPSNSPRILLPRPANQAARNASGVVGKRRVQLTQKAREATPRSYRPARLYLHRLSPLPSTNVVSSQTATLMRTTPHPPTPPTPLNGHSSSLTSRTPSPTPSPAPTLLPRAARRCLPPAWPTTPPWTSPSTPGPPPGLNTSQWTPTPTTDSPTILMDRTSPSPTSSPSTACPSP